MAIKIGEAVSLGNPTNETITPDDRQQTMEVIGGVVVQDYGHVEAGDRISWTLAFRTPEWEKVKRYWNGREMVLVEDAAGEAFYARVVVKSYMRLARFEGKAIEANIELWRV